MNDPGLDEPISQDVEAVDKKNVDEEDEAKETEQEFLAPSRWWFASTAFPLIAGTFGPMASAFSICALVVHWLEGMDGVFIQDPAWLTGINAAQLAIALISNLALLLNMARRLRFSIAQPVTIVGWYLSSFALISLTATGAGPLAIQDTLYTQAFYYAIFAAGLYFIVASLMVVTVIGAYLGHYEKEFKLTMSQRTLMLQTISFLFYLLGGAAVYAHIEDWPFLDAVYFTDFTLLTVGIGDLTPATHLGRSLLFPFAIGGIIILGLVIGSIRSLVLERGKVKLGARMIEKERERRLKKIAKKKESILIPVGEKNDISRASTLDERNLDERDRRKIEFQIMREIQKHAATKRRWTSLVVSGTTWFILWFAGAAIFHASEEPQGWSYFDALYFAYTSLLTIGYGDIYPESNSGKPFFVFWSLLAIPSLTILISNMGDTIVKGIRDLTLWIGNLTVLPGEDGIRAGVKATAKKVSKGKMFGDEVSEQPPGILGESKRKARDSKDGQDDDSPRKNDPESAAQRAAGDRADIETSQAKQEADMGEKHAVPKSKRHYHCVLIKEIHTVTKHLNSSPPRKYTFDEWAWYLRLVGEDEGSAETHRKAPQKPRADGEGLGVATTEQDHNDTGESQRVKWSWVGNRSPLMGDKEEAEWVLERLTTKLDRELEAMRQEELEKEGIKG